MKLRWKYNVDFDRYECLTPDYKFVIDMRDSGLYVKNILGKSYIGVSFRPEEFATAINYFLKQKK